MAQTLEEIRAKRHAYYMAHKDAMKDSARRWRVANPARYKELMKAWRDRNPDSLKRYKDERRARDAEARRHKDHDEKLAQRGMSIRLATAEELAAWR